MIDYRNPNSPAFLQLANTIGSNPTNPPAARIIAFNDGHSSNKPVLGQHDGEHAVVRNALSKSFVHLRQYIRRASNLGLSNVVQSGL